MQCLLGAACVTSPELTVCPGEIEFTQVETGAVMATETDDTVESGTDMGTSLETSTVSVGAGIGTAGKTDTVGETGTAGETDPPG